MINVELLKDKIGSVFDEKEVRNLNIFSSGYEIVISGIFQDRKITLRLPSNGAKEDIIMEIRITEVISSIGIYESELSDVMNKIKRAIMKC